MTPRISFEASKPFKPLENRPVVSGDVNHVSRPANSGRPGYQGQPQNRRPAAPGTAGTAPAAPGGARPGADRLANYSAKHREDPKKKGHDAHRPGDKR